MRGGRSVITWICRIVANCRQQKLHCYACYVGTHAGSTLQDLRSHTGQTSTSTAEAGRLDDKGKRTRAVETIDSVRVVYGYLLRVLYVCQHRQRSFIGLGLTRMQPDALPTVNNSERRPQATERRSRSHVLRSRLFDGSC